MKELYYIQAKSQGYLGNDIMFWAHGGGYTAHLDKAEIFTRKEAESIHQNRSSDIPWPKQYIDSKTHLGVDVQYLDSDMKGLVEQEAQQ